MAACIVPPCSYIIIFSLDMTERNIKVAVLQMAMQADTELNHAELTQQIGQAAAEGVDLIVLPELHNHRYFCQNQNPQLFDLSESIPGPTTQWLGNLAKQYNVVIVGSVFERRASGVYHNTAVVLEADGSLAGLYRKLHIPDDPGYNEKFYFTLGDGDCRPIATSVGRLGLLVCWDQWYPEAARLMALAGAEILIYPTAIGWDAEEEDDENTRQINAWEWVQRGHAVANGLPLIASNRVGHEPRNGGGGTDFWGRSLILGPQGETLGLAADNKPELLIAEVDLAHSEQVRRIWPFLRDRRIDVYADLVCRTR